MSTTTLQEKLVHDLFELPWPDLGIEGEPVHRAEFLSILTASWRDLLGVLDVPMALLDRAARGYPDCLRALEPAAGRVDRVLAAIAEDAGVRLPPQLLTSAARECTTLIPQLLGVLATAGVVVVAAIATALEEDYGDDLSWCLLGTPEEAKAWRALLEHGDAGHFLRVSRRSSGERALAEQLDGAVPERELEDEVRSLNWLHDMTVPELRAWRDERVKAVDIAVDYLSGVPGDDVRARALRRLSPEELYLAARADEAPRGFAAGDGALHRRLDNARRRARRDVKLQREDR